MSVSSASLAGGAGGIWGDTLGSAAGFAGVKGGADRTGISGVRA